MSSLANVKETCYCNCDVNLGKIMIIFDYFLNDKIKQIVINGNL